MRVRLGRVTVAIAGTALAAVLLAACAGEAGDPPATPSPTDPPVTAPPESPTPTLPPLSPEPPEPPEPPVRPSPPLAVDAALTGVVISGVEVGCKLLQTDHGDYLLLGELGRDLPVGETVTVQGEVRSDVATTCQQGIPFQVTEVLD